MKQTPKRCRFRTGSPKKICRRCHLVANSVAARRRKAARAWIRRGLSLAFGRSIIRLRSKPNRPRRGAAGTGFGVRFLRRKTSQPPDQTKQRVRSGPLHTGKQRRTQAAGGFEALDSASQSPKPQTQRGQHGGLGQRVVLPVICSKIPLIFTYLGVAEPHRKSPLDFEFT